MVWNKTRLVSTIATCCATRERIYPVSHEQLFAQEGESVTNLVGVYLDDLLVTTISVKYVGQFIRDICVLKGKDLGEVSMFLDIGITQDNKNG